MTHFADRLDEAVRATGSPCLVGLDPHLDRLPPVFGAAHDADASRADVAAAVSDFCCQVIELVAGRVPAVKPQSAFFEALGADGALAWERVVAAAHDAGLLVIGDVKRGDIGSTAAAYSRALLEGGPGCDPRTLCDAITVNPYLGRDSIEPFLGACRAGAGLYVLVRTSNPGSADFQVQGQPTLAERVADAVSAWGSELVGSSGLSSVGAVVGATHPDELVRMRARMPHTPFLLPGYGAQGGGAADVVGGFTSGLSGALVNNSRGLLFAYQQAGDPSAWKDATSAALDGMHAAIGAALANRR